MAEIWKDIPGFDGYQASTHGRVRSYRKKGGGRKQKPRLLSAAWKTGKRYKYVLLRSGGKTYNWLVHRLILETFVGPCPEGMEACHYDCNATNNRLDNLRWDSTTNNGADTRRVNVAKKGKRAAFLQTIETRQRSILRRYLILRAMKEVEAETGQTQREIAAKYGVTEFYLSRMKNGRYKHKSLKEFQLD